LAHPSDVQVAQGERGQAHDDGLDVQLAGKDGHVQHHERLGGEGPDLCGMDGQRCMRACNPNLVDGLKDGLTCGHLGREVPWCYVRCIWTQFEGQPYFCIDRR